MAFLKVNEAAIVSCKSPNPVLENCLSWELRKSSGKKGTPAVRVDTELVTGGFNSKKKGLSLPFPLVKADMKKNILETKHLLSLDFGGTCVLI